MDAIIGVCGLVCSECPGYLATQANDEAAKERVAAEWRVYHNNPNINAVYVTCDGCLASEGRLGGHCLECNIRQCGYKKSVLNCAYCPDYSCEMLDKFLAFVPAAKTKLDEIHRLLG